MIHFVKLKEEHLEMVLQWRIKTEVAQFMFTKVENDIENQRQWFKRISADPRYRYWVIYCGAMPIGVVNLAAIDLHHRHCTAGYYIGDLAYLSLGMIIPAYLYNHVFKVMGFRKIYGEVVSHNEKILKIHAMHGYRQVGVCRGHVCKDGQYHDVVLVELLSEAWLSQKKYQRYNVEFE